MSGHSLILFVSLIAIAVAANNTDDTATWSPTKRGPASINGVKDLGLSKKDFLKHTHKVRGPLAVVVELVGQRPEQPGDVFVLKGMISSEQPLDNVEFSWRLPAGVEVVNGQMASTIAALSEDAPFETQITLRQVSPLNEHVTLHVRGHDGDMRFGDTAVYHTLDQEALQAARQELRETSESYQKANQMTEVIPKYKVMH